MDAWFIKIELELLTGRTFESVLTREQAVELAKSFVIEEDQLDSDLGVVRAAFDTLAYRADSGDGGIVLPGDDGGYWFFQAASIAAFGFAHRLDLPGVPPAIEIGYRQPLAPPR